MMHFKTKMPRTRGKHAIVAWHKQGMIQDQGV